MSLCPYAYLRVSLSGLLTASDQGSLTTFGELFNISALDPLLPTLLIATLCLCALLTILYYSLVVAWEVFWATRRSPSPLDPSTEVVLTASSRCPKYLPSKGEGVIGYDGEGTETEGSNQEGWEKGVQGGDVEKLSNSRQRPLTRCC